MPSPLGARLTPHAMARTGVAVFGAAVALWVATGITATLALNQIDPDLALSIWPYGARTKAAVVSRSLDNLAGKYNDGRALSLSRTALAREPVNAEAARDLAMSLAFRDPAAANRMFGYAERLSRRDLATQLWLIQAAVDRGDVPTALAHYDRALRTSERAADILFPTLVAAADDPRVATELGRFLAVRPPWWRGFLLREIAGAKNPASLVFLVAVLGINLNAAEDAEIARLAISKLVDGQHFAEAGKLYTKVTTGRFGSVALLRDGKFEGSELSSPFDWWITDQSDPSAVVVNDDGQRRLQLKSSSTVASEVARQLLLLKPGNYTLSIAFGLDAGSAAPMVQLRCAQGQDIKTVKLAANGVSATRLVTSVQVDSKCSAQWLAVQIAQGTPVSAWISHIDITAGNNE